MSETIIRAWINSHRSYLLKRNGPYDFQILEDCPNSEELINSFRHKWEMQYREVSDLTTPYMIEYSIGIDVFVVVDQYESKRTLKRVSNTCWVDISNNTYISAGDVDNLERAYTLFYDNFLQWGEEPRL